MIGNVISVYYLYIAEIYNNKYKASFIKKF